MESFLSVICTGTNSLIRTAMKQNTKTQNYAKQAVCEAATICRDPAS